VSGHLKACFAAASLQITAVTRRRIFFLWPRERRSGKTADRFENFLVEVYPNQAYSKNGGGADENV